MKNSVSNYISDLLFLHDCVILPEFGGFIGNKKSAVLNTTTKTLSPPTKQLLFNKNLSTNDGLLINHIANKEKISNKEAYEIVVNFSNQINKKLKESKVLRIEKIGLFTIGKEQNITFVQETSINYSLTAFGMTNVYNKPIIRKAEIRYKVKDTVKTIKTKNITPRVILRAAAIILPLITLSYLSIWQEDRINVIYGQMANLNPFTALVNQPETNIEEIKTTLTTKSIIKENIKIDLPVINHYYIIAGAFSEKINANRMMNKLNKWGYKPELLLEKGLIRVSYNSFSNKDAAIVALNEIRKQNKAAWVLTK